MFAFAAKKSDLARSLDLCKGIVEKKNTVPILANVRMHWSSGNVIFTATDMDMEIAVVMPASGKSGDEQITVPAATLSDIVKKAADDEITGNVQKGIMHLRAGKAKFTLGTLPAEDFPIFGPK